MANVVHGSHAANPLTDIREEDLDVRDALDELSRARAARRLLAIARTKQRPALHAGTSHTQPLREVPASAEQAAPKQTPRDHYEARVERMVRTIEELEHGVAVLCKRWRFDPIEVAETAFTLWLDSLHRVNGGRPRTRANRARAEVITAVHRLFCIRSVAPHWLRSVAS